MRLRSIPLWKLSVGLLLVALCGAPPQSVFGQTTLTNGLVAYWPFDTTDGVSTPDLALNNSLLLFNGPSLAASGIGTHNTTNCFTFNGTSQYLDLPHSTNFAASGLPVYTLKGYTVAFWVKGLSTQAANKIIFSDNNINNAGLLFEFNNSTTKIRVNIRGDDNVTHLNNVASATAVFDTTGTNWHHIAWVDTNGTAKLYIDGNLDATSFNYTPQAQTAPPTANVLSVGALVRTSVGNFFAGSVDEVMCWNRVLSQAEIQSVMNSGIPEPIAGTPPIFVTQPASRTNSMGDMATFSTSVFGSQPMSFQWYSNGIALAGATNNAVTLTSLTAPGTFPYTVTAANAYGTNSSNPANLVVLADPTNNLFSGLVAYWPFNTISNSISSPDLISQTDMQLTAMSGANLVPGEFGNALAFDGATQYAMETTGTPIYDLSTTYTVALWVKGASGIANEQTFANGNSTNGNYFFIAPDNTGATGKVDVRINPGMADTLSTSIAFDGNWHHIVWVDQNGSGLLYVDGVLDPTVYSYTHGALGSVALNNTTIGALVANPLRDFYNGNVDDVGTWSRRLTYSEIQSIYMSGIPAPPVIIKPSVTSLTTQPPDTTSSVYQGDTVTFTVLAAGTSPFSYHWQYNNLPISAVSNPSAVSNVLVLTNVQPGNSGPYSVVITNTGGAITSTPPVQLTVIPYTPVTNGTALQVEFNWKDGPIVQPGFSSMTLNANPAIFNGPEITLSPIGSTSLSDRERIVPTNNPPVMTQADIYQQIIFSTANVQGTGIDLLVQRLAPNTAYGLTMWSFDSQNTGYSDWTEVASGTPVPITGNPGGLPYYYFNGSQLPKTNYDNTFGAVLTSSASGQLELQGVVDGFSPSSITVFINAIRLVANPTIQITGVAIAADGNLQLTVMTQYPWQPMHFLESSNLAPGSWQPAADLISSTVNGPVVTAEFPFGTNQLFYRVVSP